ncbi:hypothetical protein C5167_011614, partial [Papaver somniferum]
MRNIPFLKREEKAETDVGMSKVLSLPEEIQIMHRYLPQHRGHQDYMMYAWVEAIQMDYPFKEKLLTRRMKDYRMPDSWTRYGKISTSQASLIFRRCCKRTERIERLAALNNSSSYSERGSDLAYSVRANVSAYRVSMIIVTCLCILVVDFTIYPRRYAKTETYCTGLICTLPRSGAADMYSNCKQRIYTRICKKCDRYVLRFVSSAAYMYSNLLAY